jgi:CubicO group peptidase (beta-lactamase class C family)
VSTEVKALFFDVFGTLVDWRNGIAREAEIILKPLGMTLDWLAFADAWRDEYQPAMEDVRAGRVPFCKLDVLPMRLPISPGLVFREISAMGGVDLRDLRGWRFVAPGTPPDGFAIDGAMDAAERAFHADGKWFVLVHDREAILVTITLSENLAARIPFGIVYDDDATRVAPPERVPGSVPLVGFRGREVERLPPDRYRFDLRVFLLPDYRSGDAERVLRERDAPLVVSVPASDAGGRASPR